MDKFMEKQLALFAAQRKKRKRFVALLLCLSMLIGTGVFAALSQEGIAMTRVERVLDCHFSVTAREGYADYAVHVHNADCYDEAGNLLCPLPEIAPHIHSEDCYRTENVLSCGLEESAGHQHREDCYALVQGELLCGQEESWGHSHDESCYTSEQGALLCGLEESEEHQHTDACYEWVNTLSCGQEAQAGHQHTDACYAWNEEQICGLEEGTGSHAHGETCYETVTARICGQQELHTHTESCYDADGNRVCGMLQLEEHVHGPGCFAEAEVEKELVVPLEAAPDPDADVESWWDYAGRFETMNRSGPWNEVLVAVAKTQLGYTESERNFIYDENGQKQSYTRYGAWYGIPYGEWCAMFVSFCLNFAEIPTEVFPIECGVTRWVDDLRARGLYAAAADAAPKPGDVIFFDFNGDGLGDHVGIVTMTDEPVGELETIEGNRTPTVELFRYTQNDPTIMGYGILPERPAEETAKPLAEPPASDTEESVRTDDSIEPDDADKQEENTREDEPAMAQLDLGLARIESTDGKALPADTEGHAYTLDSSEADSVWKSVEDFLAGQELASTPMKGPRRMSGTATAAASAKTAENHRSETRYQVLEIGLENVDAADYEGGFCVSVTLPEALTGRDFHLYHIRENEVEELILELISSENGDGTEIVSGFSFVTDSFSPFVLSYTVDFHFDGRSFCINGYGEILLSELFTALGADYDVAAVSRVEFSNPEYIMLEKLAGDWTLTSLAPFTSEETLTVLFTDGNVLVITVTDAQHVDELALMLESAALYEDGNLIEWPAAVRENKMYDIRLTFKENSVYQFLDTADEMYYPVPEGLDLGDEDFEKTFTMDVGDGITLEGNIMKYDHDTNRFTIRWNTADKTSFNKLIASNSAEFRIDFKAYFTFDPDSIEFSDNIIGKVTKDTSYDVDVTKTGVYNEDEDRIDYTVTVSSYGEAENVKVYDELFGTALTYISTGENRGVSWESSIIDGHTDNAVALDAEQPENGFALTIGHMDDGEVLTFTYSASVDYDKLTGSGTYDETYNKVTVDAGTPKTVDHSFTGSLHYVKLQKDHERPINWNGDNATITWFITVNEEFKVGMKGTVISDRIYAGDVEAMDYSGTGLHVAVYDNTGAFVGAYDVPWEDSAITRNALGIDAETEEIDYASWQYTIPDKQAAADENGNAVTIDNSEHYKYVVSYTTDADKSLMVFDGYIGNEAKESKTDNEMQDGFYPPGTGTVPEVRKAVETEAMGLDTAYHAPNGSNEDYIYWVITFDRQAYTLTRCVIEDNNPTLWGNAEPVDVSRTADDSAYEYLYVEGLTDSESWEVSAPTDTRTTIKFYRDPDKTQPGLLKADASYTGEEGGSANTITIHLRTKNSAIWMDGTLTKYWPRVHTNTVTWIPNAHQVEAEAEATPEVRKMQKEGYPFGTVIRDGVTLPVFRFDLYLAGIDDDSFDDEGNLSLHDVFDTEKLKLMPPQELKNDSSFVYSAEAIERGTQLQDYWDQKLKGYSVTNGWTGPVPVETTDYTGEDGTGLRFTVTKADFAEKGMEPGDASAYCLRYSLPYYLVVKDAEAAKAMAEEARLSGAAEVLLSNTATWEKHDITASTTVEATFKPTGKSVSYNEQKDLATYTVTLNPQALTLNNGQMIRVEDTYSNLAVDFSTVKVLTPVSALGGTRDATTGLYDVTGVLNWSYHSNKGTFWIPDATPITITYQAQPIGDAGKNTTFTNTVTMLSYTETVEKTVTLNAESEGSAGDYNIRLFK